MTPSAFAQLLEQRLPDTFYHGTDKDFDVFRRAKLTPQLQLGFGFHFTTDPAFARLYGKRIIEARLTAANVLDTRQVVTAAAEELFAIAVKLGGKRCLFNGAVWLQNAVDATGPARAERVLRDAGFDAVWYTGEHGTRPSGLGYRNAPQKAPCIVVMDAAQITAA